MIRLDGMSDKFGRAVARFLPRGSWDKIPMARPDELDVPSKRTRNAEKISVKVMWAL